MIIYSPFIADTIPGFDTSTIKIPYTDSLAVGKGEIKGYSLKMRPYNSQNKTDEEILTITGADKTGVLTFKPTSLVAGQYYKFQLAYIALDDTVGPYSSVAIGRCVGTPELTIAKTDNGAKYEGQYTTNVISEPVYSYQYVLRTEGTVLYDTQSIIHNTSLDSTKATERISKFPFYLKVELETYKTYTLELTITTINGYVATVSQSLINEPAAPPMFEGGIQCYNDIDNGYIGIALTGSTVIEGTYLLERRAADENIWHTMTQFQMLRGYKPSDYTWKDHSVEQGVYYIYSIRHCYNNNKFSQRIESQPIKAEFEHMFLSDADKTLRIAFNPKVSSFKDTILEQKMDTIGGQYPFFFRNNQVRYKEIPISGLLSYLEDTEGFFGEQSINSVDLTGDNFAAERKFKLAVLNWLTNGEPKLFRSPAEGNYAVRLMNTSLSPNDTLGRMLHTFSATGYECMDTDYETLVTNKIVPSQEVKLHYLKATITLGTEIPAAQKIRNVTWVTANPDTEIKIKLDDTEYINFTGVFQTAEDDIYTTIEIGEDALRRGDEISFDYIPAGAIDPTQMVEHFTGYTNQTRVLISIDNNNTSVLQEFNDIEWLCVTAIDLMSENALDYNYTFNGETFSCMDGQTREFRDGFTVRQIQTSLTGGSKVRFYILGSVSDSYVSTLGKFILGYSKLGGN